MGWKSLVCASNILPVLPQPMPGYNMYYSRLHLAMPSLPAVLNGIHLLSTMTLLQAKRAFDSSPHCHWYPRLLAWHFSLSRLEVACSLLEICYSSHAEA